MAREKWNEAEAWFTKALTVAPNYYSAWIGIGEAREASQQWSEAGAAYAKALELNGKSAEPYVRIAQLGVKTGDWKKVAEYSEAALGIDARDLPDAYNLCALANFKLNLLDTAESSARAGLKLEAANEAPELWLTLGLVQADEKRYADAAASLRRYLALVPGARTVKEIAIELSALEAALAADTARQAAPNNWDE
jgi:tetratricopeptide (TPR) repeat protein